MLLLVALLVGTVAVPAEGKRPRRYDTTVLMDWTICPTHAKLTIGFQGSSEAPDPNLDRNTWPKVDLNAQLPSSAGSLIVGGLQTYSVTDTPNQEISGVVGVADGAGEVVTDVPLNEDGTEIPVDPTVKDTITHQEPVEVRWSQPVDVRGRIRLGLGESGAELAYGLFEAVYCAPTEGGQTGGSSPGVTTAESSVTTEEIRDLAAQIDENRQVGLGPDGSLVPRSECTIVGTSGRNRIQGTPGNDVICGLGGNDRIDGADGLDVIDGADGRDRLSGGSGVDRLLGLRGNDALKGNGGDDRARGGAGDDRLSGGKGHDDIRAGFGKDRIGARDRTRDKVDGGSGWDRATVDRLGSPRPDRVRGVERLR